MFERIISINNNYAIVKISNNFNNDILNYNVIFEDSNKRILGEINEVINFEAKISFLGEFIDNKFFSGLIRKPSPNSRLRIINQQELGELVNSINSKSINLGTSPLYNNYPIKVDINDMFSNHTLILGNGRVGKTSCATKIIQNLFNMKDKIPFNSNIFIFSDSYEYNKTFSNLNKINSSFNYKLYSSDKSNDNVLKIPLWLMDVYDFSHLLEANNYFQVRVIEKMLNYVSLFSKDGEDSDKYKNHLIASAMMRVLYSNQINTRIREQIFEILNCCSTKDLNLNKEVPGIGYNKKFIKCFDLDKHGEFIEREIVSKYIQTFINDNYKFNFQYEPTYFTLEQLESALDFVMISDGIIFNDKLYNDTIMIKDNLHKINNSFYREFFDLSNYITVEQFINSLVQVNNKSRAQIVNFMFDNLDSSFSNSLVKILCKIIYNFNNKSNGSIPIYIIFDDTNILNHNENDNMLFGYNIFHKIFKDGKRIGISINLVTDNVSQVDKKILLQFANYILFKLNNESDLDYISKLVPEINSCMIEKINSLQVGTCLISGKIMKIPMIVKLELPNIMTNDDSLSIYDKWIVDFNK